MEMWFYKFSHFREKRIFSQANKLRNVYQMSLYLAINDNAHAPNI